MLLLIVFLLASEFHREATAPSRSVRGRIQGDSQTPSRRRRLASRQTEVRSTLSMLQTVGIRAMGRCRARFFKQRLCQTLAEWRNRFSASAVWGEACGNPVRVIASCPKTVAAILQNAGNQSYDDGAY